MPYIHFIITVTLFTFIPAAVVVIYAHSLIYHDVWGTQLGAWILLYVLLSLFMVIWFWVIVSGFLVDLKDQYFADMELDKEEEVEMARKKTLRLSQTLHPLINVENLDPANNEYIDEDMPDRVPYTKRERFNGYGPLRIGQPFEFWEDLYSLMFIATIRRDYREACEDEERQKKKAINKVIKQTLDLSFSSSELEEDELEEEEESEKESEEKGENDVKEKSAKSENGLSSKRSKSKSSKSENRLSSEHSNSKLSKSALSSKTSEQHSSKQISARNQTKLKSSTSR